MSEPYKPLPKDVLLEVNRRLGYLNNVRARISKNHECFYCSEEEHSKKFEANHKKVDEIFGLKIIDDDSID